MIPSSSLLIKNQATSLFLGELVFGIEVGILCGIARKRRVTHISRVEDAVLWGKNSQTLESVLDNFLAVSIFSFGRGPFSSDFDNLHFFPHFLKAKSQLNLQQNYQE